MLFHAFIRQKDIIFKDCHTNRRCVQTQPELYQSVSYTDLQTEVHIGTLPSLNQEAHSSLLNLFPYHRYALQATFSSVFKVEPWILHKYLHISPLLDATAGTFQHFTTKLTPSCCTKNAFRTACIKRIFQRKKNVPLACSMALKNEEGHVPPEPVSSTSSRSLLSSRQFPSTPSTTMSSLTIASLLSSEHEYTDTHHKLFQS